MRIYLIAVKKHFIDYDDFTVILTIAESPEQAREDTYDYVSSHGYRENAKCFLDPDKSVIKEMPLATGVIASKDLKGNIVSPRL